MRPGAAGTSEHATPSCRAEVFTWPPRTHPEEGPEAPGVLATEADPRTSLRPADGRVSQFVRELEHAWLGVAARSWRGARKDASEFGQETPYCPRCGTSVGPFEADVAGCSACRGKRLVWERCVRLGPYEGSLRDAILLGKYTAWRRTCQDLGRELGLAVAAALHEAGIPPASVVVCPVATSARRRLARGVDHTLVLAREVARETGGRLVQGLRRRHRPPQQGLSQEARRRNVSGSFRARGRVCARLDGRVIVLVDDVRTTGATLTAAGRALREGVRARRGREREIWAAVAAVVARG